MGTKDDRTRLAAGNVLFGATRKAVLGLLFGEPDARFYQRQIIQRLHLGSGAVQRELARLTRAGILVRTVEGRQTYFQADREGPLFAELRGIVRKTVGVAHALGEALEPLGEHVSCAFVHGSIAAGTENALSDIDLFIVGDTGLADVVSCLAGAQRELGREVNPSIYTAQEFRRKLATGQRFVTKVMASPKLFVIGDERNLRGLARERLASGARNEP